MKYLTLSVLLLALMGCANNTTKTPQEAAQQEQKAATDNAQLQDTQKALQYRRAFLHIMVSYLF